MYGCREICKYDFNPEFSDFRAFCAKPFEPNMVAAITEFTEDAVIDRVAEEIKRECGLDSCFGEHGLTDTAILLFKVRCFRILCAWYVVVGVVWFADSCCCFQICAAALRIYVEKNLKICQMVENMRGNFPEALSRVMGGKPILELGLTDREIVEVFATTLGDMLG